MRDDLLHYYERELTFLRQTGAEFARKYPKVASRLLLEPNKCDDPHVERLLEGFAFLAARVHLKIDDDFPEISEALLNVVYPNYIRPLPSMAIMQLELDRQQGKLATGFSVPRGAEVRSAAVRGTRCRFRTAFDLTLWPLKIADASWTTPHDLRPAVRTRNATEALRVQLETEPDLTFGELQLDRLRFYVGGDTGLGATLYELLLNRCVEILVRKPGASGERSDMVRLPPESLRGVGFGEDEALIPFERRSFEGFRLLQEYLSFPQKYLFLELSGLEALREAGFGAGAEIVFLIAPYGRPERRDLLEAGVTETTLQLGCTPVINLFQRTSEPVRLTHRRHEYLVVPDARRREFTGIHSVDAVSAVTPASAKPLVFEPFYSFRHGAGDGPRTFWYARRKAAGWRTDEATDVYLSFVDRSSRPVYPEYDAVTARLTCHNGDLPNRLPLEAGDGGFELPGGGPIERITAVVKPTKAVEPPLGKPQLWRLISQFSLNYVTLMDAGVEGLREVLRLHDLSDSRFAGRQIEGVVEMTHAPVHARLRTEHGLAFARGHRVDIQFDEEEFAGGGIYMFACVLERFFGASVSLNSFSQLGISSRQRKERIRLWPPRSGSRQLM